MRKVYINAELNNAIHSTRKTEVICPECGSWYEVDSTDGFMCRCCGFDIQPKIRLIVLAGNKITFSRYFMDADAAEFWVDCTFPESELVRKSASDAVLKSGMLPVNIIAGPINYMGLK